MKLSTHGVWARLIFANKVVCALPAITLYACGDYVVLRSARYRGKPFIAEAIEVVDLDGLLAKFTSEDFHDCYHLETGGRVVLQWPTTEGFE